jgi:anthranilate synthase/aminodeoxychorismate synthase-like glutamine amidotransferase
MLLIIDNYDSFTYNLYQSVAQLTDELHVVRNDRITLTEINQLNPTGIILSPGPGRPETAGICIDLIRTTDTPLLGVCLGHQAIIAAFGGEVIGAPDIVHGKTDIVFHSRKGLYHDLPLPFTAGRYHSLIADRAQLPAELIIEAENAAGCIMGVRHRTLPIFGVQFHPESILTPQGNQLLHNFTQLCTAGVSA